MDILVEMPISADVSCALFLPTQSVSVLRFWLRDTAYNKLVLVKNTQTSSHRNPSF